MCGIAGFVGDQDATILEKMVASLLHRGPDEAGFWNDGRTFLGMRRLAVVDLSTGQQPIFNEDGTLVIVYNGEIYNHHELRDDLIARGHCFRTHHCDTEVLVHLYEEHGDDFLDHVNGMFALAIWDMPRKRLFLARDRSGIKPLYYAELSDGIVFGSEPKALLAHPAVSHNPDFSALHHYFSLKNTPAPQSAFTAISQLHAGEYLVYENGSLRKKRWWRPVMARAGLADVGDAPERLRSLLEDAVRRQMEADVPFGAYLSGGVDSSAIVALMSRQLDARVKTFTLTYDDEGLPNKDADRQHAREVAQLFSTEHLERVITPDELIPAIDDIVTAFDEPYSGVMSTFFLTKLIAQHVTVALSGDGADELFGSYASHRLAEPILLCDQEGRPGAGEVETATNGLSPGDKALAAKLLNCADAAAARLQLCVRDEAAKRHIYSPRMKDLVADSDTRSLFRKLIAESDGADPINRMLYVDQLSLLPDQVLPFVDRLSMAHSIEVRPPFLDHRIVEFANALPGHMKIRNGCNKAVLKDAMQGILPNSVLSRPKEGFLMPINHWLANHHGSWLAHVLDSDRLARHGLLDRDAVTATIDGFRRNPENKTGDQLWNLVMFQLWWERYVAA